MNEPQTFSELESDRPVAPVGPPAAGTAAILRPWFASGEAGRGLAKGDRGAEGILQAMPVAVCLCDAAARLTFFNRRAAIVWGWSDGDSDAGALAEWFTPADQPAAVEPALSAVLRSGLPCRDVGMTLRRRDGSCFDANVTIEPLREADGGISGAMVVAIDVAEPKLRDRHQELLARLSERLTTEHLESDLVHSTAQLVGEYLGVQRCGFVENERGSGMLKVISGWMREPLPSLAGRHDRQVLGDAEWQRSLCGMRIAIDDVATHPHTAAFAEHYRVRGVRAYAAAPFVRAGQWVAALTVTCNEPRPWREDELGLLEQAIARVWPLIERARSQSALELITANAPVVLSYLDRESRIVFANQAFAVRWQTSSADLTGRKLAELIGEPAFAVVKPHVDEVLAGRPVQFETELPDERAGVRYVRFSLAPDRDDEGRVRGYLSAVNDLTDRRAMEQAVLESEERFRALAEHAPVGIFRTDTAGQCTFVNEHWCRMTGMAAADALGDGWVRALHPDDRSRMLEDWRTARAQGRPFACEHRILRADGVALWLQASAVETRNPKGEVTGSIGTAVDITDRKLAEFGLRESEKRFRLVASRAPVGIFMSDAQGHTTFVNASWCKMADLSPEDAQGCGWMAAVHPEDRAKVVADWQEAVRNGVSSKAEFRFLRRDGTITWVQGNAVQLRDTNGRLTGYIGTVADFTERKAAELAVRASEEELRRAQDELLAHAGDLERKVEARTASLREAIVQMEEFSYSVSHDLRAPLRAMNAYAEALSEDYGSALDETGRDYLRRIQRSSQRMERLTHDMLSFSRVARAEIVMAPVDLKSVLRDLLGQYAELQPHAADLSIEEPLLAVRAHELSLGQCLGNLLTNAAKFVAPGTRPRIRVSTQAVGDMVRVSIRDHGIGIRPEHQRNLFQMFERVPTPVPYEGTGIGLAIVRKAIEKMGGRYGVESDGVDGSCFWIELPKA